MKNPRKRIMPMGIVAMLIIASVISLDLSRHYLLGEFDKNTIEFEMLYSSEKGKWLEEVAPIFEKEYDQTHDTSLKLVLNPIGSGKGTLQVARSMSKPVVWSPASRFWLTTLNYLWMQEHDNPMADPNSPALVISPTVIATWQSYSSQHNITSLQDLHDLALNDPNFTYAHTDPSRSNSGFGGVIMQVASSLKKSPEQVTLEDLADDDVQQWMRDLEGAAIEYGSSTGFLAKLLVNGGPSKLKVALIYENLVVEKNKGISEYGYNDSLVAIYPKEGTVLNDHPYAILDAPWVSDAQKKVANEFLEFLLRPDIQEKAVRTGFRPAINNIDPAIEQSVFNSSVGVIPSLKNITIYSIANIDGAVLQRIPDLWLATRATDSDNNQVMQPIDYVVPGILVFLMLMMIIYPIISVFRRD